MPCASPIASTTNIGLARGRDGLLDPAGKRLFDARSLGDDQ